MAEEKKKILIIQTAYLGDVILALPMVQTLHSLMPDAVIDFLCIPITANVLENHPAINRVIRYDKKGKDKLGKLIEIIGEVKKEHYDIVLTPHRSLRSALITYFSKAPERIGFEKNSMSFLLTHKVIYESAQHEIQRNLDLLGAIPGIVPDDTKISARAELYPAERDVKIIDELLKPLAASKIAALAPCSKWYTKQLTKEKTVEIIRELLAKEFSIVLTGGADDFEYAKAVEKEISSDKLVNLAGRLSPVESYLSIKKSQVLITVDSAAQHLGAAAGVPIVLIYGSTNKSFGFYPLTGRYTIVENAELRCRPCTDHGKNACPLGHFKCIKELSANNIVEEAINLINQPEK